MAVAFDAKSVNSVGNGSTSPHGDGPGLITVGTGSNRALIVGLSFSGGTGTGVVPPGLAVRWDVLGTNQAMTQITGATANQTVASASAVVLFGLVAPTSGDKVVQITWTGGTTQDIYMVVISFTGVDQTGGASTFPNGAGNSNSGTANNPATITITSSSSNAIVAMHIDNNVSGSQTMNQTTWLTSNAGSSSNMGSNYAVGSGTAALTCTWSTNARWAVAGTDVAAVAVAGQPAMRRWGGVPGMIPPKEGRTW